MKTLKVMHWLGLVLLFSGVALYLFTDISQVVSGIVTVSTLIGLGAVMISPFPVVLFIQWAKAHEKPKV
ncbi:hypothetical protein HWQ46_21605 [Shewanella sp. D64]|uniref:hypothetical protein n=1 Tax=unclassified Shewanella TaxID=196818 RepID=UPI0022BA65E4|nr:MULTISPECIES: hypothetical protein [unclassified Shewanella]MEC4728136.1 hypothetical protein [Shewanella sp. D64]MEC4740256.1 hypothetical protein [Shewanella sp. E94]WBJ94427.1 hypothetical protein HWQ47_21545 [Shewanella sp. MTB7]